MLFLGDILIKLLNMSITATYVIIIIMAVRFLLKKFPKKYSYYLWGIVGFRLIFPFSITSVFSFFNLDTFRNINSGNYGMEYIPLDIGFIDTPMVDIGVGSVNKTVNSLFPAAEIQNSINPMQIYIFIAVIFWILGIITILTYELFLFFRMKRVVKKAILYKDNIYECDNIKTPFIMGFIRPKIYIPFRLSEKEFSYILCHEKYHIKRHDNIIKIIAFFILIIYWFNPFIWLAYFYMNKDMEMSCDEKVILEMGVDSIKGYSYSLLSFAINRRKLPFGHIAFGESYVGKRVKNILRFKKPKLWISIVGILIVFTISVVCITNKSEVIKEIKANDIFKDVKVTSERINFMLVGFDGNKAHADTIIAGSYLVKENQLNIVSIPRDTYITFTDNQKELMNRLGENVPKSTKISLIKAYAKDDYNIEFLKEQVEDILDIKIDYYFKVDIDKLKNIVDSIGGIYFTVQEEGMYYSDSIQNLNINIDGGYQLLNGSDAIDLIRFRKGYSRGDLQRIEVSREFIKEFIKQIIDKGKTNNNLDILFIDCIKNVETNFNIIDITKYIKSIENFNFENFNSETLPGNYQIIEGINYYIYDNSETKKIVKKFFH